MAVTNTPNTADMLQKDLYVIFTRAVAPREEIMKMLPKHLERQVELEKQGILDRWIRRIRPSRAPA